MQRSCNSFCKNKLQRGWWHVFIWLTVRNMVPSVPVLPPTTGTSCNVMVYSLSQSFSTRCITLPVGLSFGDSTTKVQLVIESPYPGLKICSKHQQNLHPAHICPQHRPPRMSADKWINLLSSPQKRFYFSLL